RRDARVRRLRHRLADVVAGIRAAMTTGPQVVGARPVSAAVVEDAGVGLVAPQIGEQREAQLLRLLRVPSDAGRRGPVRTQLGLVVIARLSAQPFGAHWCRAGSFGPA